MTGGDQYSETFVAFFQTLPLSRENTAGRRETNNDEWTIRDGFRTPRTTSVEPWRSCPADRQPSKTCSPRCFSLSMTIAEPTSRRL